MPPHIKFFLLILATTFILSTNVNATSIIYFNDFENDILGQFPSNFIVTRNTTYSTPSGVCKNGSLNAYWKVENVYGSKMLGITLNGPSCVYEIVPSNLAIPDSQHYILEVDAVFPTSMSKHRNIAFKYKSPSEWYDIKIYNSYDIEFQKIVFNGYPDLGNVHLTSPLVAGTKYKFKFVIEASNIKLFINDTEVYSVDDKYPILANNTIAMQASNIQQEGSTPVYFDNIKVFDTSPPHQNTPTPTITPTTTPSSTPSPTPTITLTPTPTPFPYFSQRDPQWNYLPYDHLDKTIEDSGCAISSVAMVLKSYGIDKVPWGDSLRQLTPSTLNDWLNITPEKYWRNGKVNWSTISSLTKHLHASNSAYPKLEVEILASSAEAVMDKINAGKPVIISQTKKESPSGVHYVVGYAPLPTPTNYHIAINDPYTSTRTNTTLPPLSSAIHYYTTNSDFSYFWLNTDTTLHTTINPSVPSHIELPTDNDSENTPLSEPFIQFSSKWPPKGRYNLTFTADSPGWYSYELYTYNRQGEVSFDQVTLYFTRNPIEYELDYDPDLPQHRLVRKVSFTILKELIIYTYNQKWLNLKTKEQLYRFIENAEKVYRLDPRSGKNLVRVFATHLENNYHQSKLLLSGYTPLINETAELVSAL